MSAVALAEVTELLRVLPATAGDDAARVDLLRQLDTLKSVAAAAQAQLTADFVASQRESQRAAGVPADRVGRGVAAQVALALRCSPYRAQRYTGWATILTSELPQTFAALRRGETSEWWAMLVARETIFLSREHRGVADAELAPRLQSLGDRKVEAETRKLAYALDPAGYVERARHAVNDRRVGVRPAPDTMCRLTGLLPVVQGVAAYAALRKEADRLLGDGDPRSRGQIMADTLVQRLTGQAAAEAVPVEVNLVMSDQTLLGESDEPGQLDGYGPIPAPLARDLALDTPANAWLRRLFRTPGSSELAAMETRRRAFTASQRTFLRLRDQTCRSPWCDAPIRHADHIVGVENGGPTSIDNGQGLCAACNYAKQARGWDATVTAGIVELRTPTGHVYRHRAPDPPRARPRPSPVERRFAQLLAAA